MSDTAKRDAVLMHYRGFDHRKSAFKPSTAEYEMADRIVELEAAAERAERILAALREPSEAVVEMVFAAMLLRNLTTKDIIRAAVAAAEREVGRE